ncbi:alkylation response protein AidB-like acyl-CoA dehydrogenase [Actinocorallia herbida]|uniref:Alkylation response protein AidB-like acyl-CoA dehydrogenase n=1 Tax=Actinocorallia herbida TaxID=58109 RepID=A0A3N1CXI5_9ACTN|nr:acyl-CoA dehydrogenase [Actinocorallia herbida]ROO86012.1 alkylation response protein AidB-like acyl-CoA dehydrogenase [Actinocorallia herbida]
MTLGLTEEQTGLAEAVAGFAARHAPRADTRAALDRLAEGELPGSWDALAAQGFLAVHLPEECDGGGGTGVDLAVVVEEMARGLYPGQFLATVLTSAVLTWAVDGPAPEAALKRFAAGARGTFSPATDALIARETADGYTVTGTTGHLLSPAHADLILLGARAERGAVWFLVDASALAPGDIAAAAGVDPTRDVGRLTLKEYRVSGDQVVALDEARAADVVAALCAADAVGHVRWCLETGLAYVKTREQFGRPVGSFQAIKHKCARMFVEREMLAASAWDAARALGGPAGQLALAAAGAAVTCVPAARRLALETITLLGGIGYTWEHDAHFAWRRGIALAALIGANAVWERRLGAAALVGERDFTLELPEEDPAFRAEIAAVIGEAAGLPLVEGRALLARTGLVAPHFPAPYGRAATPVEQLVIAQEYEAAGLAQPSMVIGEWALPTVIAHGTTEQVETLVPPTLRGELVWCQLFSEPGAGSDLASLTTRAVKVDGGWRLAGQKVWTSSAHEADWGICLARTDPDAPKHKGLSYFLVDMRADGVDIRPLREANGGHLFNEVFLNDVFVPDDRLVGAPGQGWTLARTTLGNERVSMGGMSETSLDLRALARAAGAPADDAVLRDFGGLTAASQAIAAMGLRATLRRVSGLKPGAEASLIKVAAGWQTARIGDTALEWAGDAALRDGSADDVVHAYLSVPPQLIGGGTVEIQLNVIAERILGLPRG